MKYFIVSLLFLTGCAHVILKGETCQSFCETKDMTCETARISGPIWNSCTGQYDPGPEYIYCKKITVYEVIEK